MRVRRVHVRRLPGILEPFIVEGFDDGITVVVGPNAIGKTSLARAVLGLLWPALGDRDDISLTAEVEVGGRLLLAEREAARVRWWCDGRAVAPPPVPDAHLARCFVVGFDELLVDSDTEHALAARVRRDMAGGYDLAAVRGDPRFTIRPRHAQREAEALAGAVAARAQAEQHHADLRRREDELPALEAARQAALQASDEVRRLEDQLALVAARQGLDDAANALAEFPPDLDRLHGNEAARLAEIEATVVALDDEERQRTRERDRAAQAVAACGLPADGVSERVLVELRGRVQALRERERELAATSVDVAAARGLAAAAEATLGEDRGDTPPVLAPGVLGRAAGWIARAAELDGEARQIRIERALVEEEGKDEDVDVAASRLLADTLRAWLAAPEAAPPSRRVAAAVSGLAALAVALATSLALLDREVAWLGGAALAVGLLLVAWRAARPREHARPGSRAQIERHAAGHGALDLPAWEREAVERRLAELDRAIAAGEAGRQRAARRVALDARARLASEARATLDAEGLALRRAAGLAPATPEAALVPFVRAVEALVTARLETARLEARAGAQRDAIASSVAELAAALRAFGEADADDGPGFEARVTALAAREQRRAAAAAEHARTVERLDAIGAELARAHQRVATLLAEAGAADVATLGRRLARLDAWRAARTRHHDARRRYQEAERRLGPDAAALAHDDAALAALLEAARARASERDALVERIATIRADVQRARVGTRVTGALAAEATARAELEDRLDEALLAAAADVLLDEVERAHAIEARPAVVARADAWFGRFTRHAWALEMAEAADAFCARETGTGQRRGLAHLSAGTRMQLLLAVRLAFALETERGEPLPLFLDEALTTSDPARRAAVVDALEALAGAGRQVVYLTSQPSDVAPFEHGGRRIAVIDLARQRRLGSAIRDAAALAAPSAPCVPRPDGLPAHEYGVALGVPSLDLRRSADAIHLFYLLHRDLPLLHRLLELGCERVGQLDALLRQPFAPDAVGGAAVAARLRAWVTVAREVRAAWTVGRPPRVDRDVLARAMPSERWLDAITAIAAAHDGDAAALLAALSRRGDRDPRLRGMKDRTIERLRQQLERLGHCDPRPVLDPQVVVCAGLAAVADGALSADAIHATVRMLLHAARAVPDAVDTSRPGQASPFRVAR